jgi:hypothetical protein
LMYSWARSWCVASRSAVCVAVIAVVVLYIFVQI